MNDLIEYTGDGDNDRQSEFHDLDLDEIGTAARLATVPYCGTDEPDSELYGARFSVARAIAR